MPSGKIERILGIDFGTSTSIVKSKRYRDGKPLGNAHHVESVTFGNGVSDPKAVTLVRINPDNTCSCGIDAEEEIDGSKIYREFKMDLESDNEETRSKAMELTGEYMKYLYERYTHQESDLGEKNDEVSTVVSFPAKWREETRSFMLEVAADAGFKNVSAMDEPSAALFAVLCRKMDEIKSKRFVTKDKDNLILIVDMGAGTTDLAVCRCSINSESDDNITAENIKNEVIVTWPDSTSDLTFGGREVDVRLRNFLVDYLCSCNMPKEVSENIVGQSTAVKTWKENTLSSTLQKNDSVRSCSIVSGCLNYFPGVKKQPFPELNREAFENIIKDDLEDYKTLVNGCLDKLDEDSEIDIVILTGGHSSWYFASELIEGTMSGIEHPALAKVRSEKERVMRLSNPQETVALGMVYSKMPFNILSKKKPQVETKKEVKTDDNGSGGCTGYPPPPPPPSELKEMAVNFLESSSSDPAMYAKSGNINLLMSTLRIPFGCKCYVWRDTTLFGTGKNGWALTEEGLFFRAMWETPRFVNWQTFRDKLQINVDSSNNINLAVDFGVPVTFNMLVAGRESPLFNLLNNLKCVLNNEQIIIEKPPEVKVKVTPPPAELSEIDKILDEKLSKYMSAPSSTMLRMTLNVPQNERVYLAYDSTNSQNGKRGTVITNRGIYATCRLGFLFGDIAHFTTWDEFRDGYLAFGDNGLSCNVKTNYQLRSIFDGNTNRDSFFAIYNEIQKELRALDGPKSDF